jgi:hypothetical protein
MISPKREPEPNPAKASTVDVMFSARTPAETRIDLEHRDFERHGAGASGYRDGLASTQGWPWILDHFVVAADTGGRFNDNREGARERD